MQENKPAPNDHALTPPPESLRENTPALAMLVGIALIVVAACGGLLRLAIYALCPFCNVPPDQAH